METFLEKLADELEARFPDGYEDICIVFPTQRAGIFFKKLIAKRRKQAIWSPDIFSVENFFAHLGEIEIPDNLTLLFELFEVFKKHFPGETFENYYFWGNLLLNDFDEVDRSLANAKQLFKNVKALKEIDFEIGLSDEENELIKKFWTSFYNTEKEPSKLKAEFLRTWKVLFEIYTDFRNELEKQNLGYAGMMYRNVAENTVQFIIKTDAWKKIYFAGLYDLSPAEEKLISVLVTSGKAQCIWDSDEYYHDRKVMEAGNFFRKSKLAEGKFLFKGNYFSDSEKKIEVIGVSHPDAQIKIASQILYTHSLEKDFAPEQTALILPEEPMLLPVLHAIPENIQKLNVTMGYPLSSSPLAELFEILFSMHRNQRRGSFYHADVLNLINHPYVQNLNDEKKLLQSWKKKCVKNGWIYLSKKNFSGNSVPSFFPTLFTHPTGSKEIFSYLFSVLKLLRESLLKSESSSGNMEAEFIFQFYSSLNRLEELFTKYKPELNAEDTWKLFREIVSDIRIPFTGEPLEGLQIMGFLEARALDFKNVFIFSMNEGILPSPSRNNSFIPFNIRRAFGLNTPEHHDSRYAYYFYRLLQRAENVYLFYNTSSKNIQGGDKSRYLLQIEQELAKIYPNNISLSQRIESIPPRLANHEKISVSKTPEILNSLKAVRWSASTLSSYISCPLQFYFKKIAKLNEADEIEETLDGATFGTVFHNAMELLYKNEKEITKEVIKKLRTKIKDAVSKSFQKEFSGNENGPEGKNSLLVKVIEELVSNVLDIDESETPFKIVMVEEFTNFSLEINRDLGTANFTGKMDRVDEKDGLVRILDYKTGKTDFYKNAELEDLFSEPKHQIIFQTFFYGLMYSKNHPNTKIKLGIYPLKKIKDGIIYPKNDVLKTDELLVFENRLKNLLVEISDKNVPFIQTEEVERCAYCEFRSICNR